jgi:dienelactone hydrolase
MTARIALTATPVAGLLDEPVAVRLSGAGPGQRVTVRARIDDGRRGRWTSHAVLEADARGTIDLATAAPGAGSYAGADPSGLFWSLAADPAAAAAAGIGALADPYTVELTAEVDGRAVGHAQVARRFMAPDVARVPVRDEGLVATLFGPASGPPRPGVLVVGGSDGGLPEGLAALVASHGFTALGLAYFRAEHLPADLVEIPLEYFETALRWLERCPAVAGDRVAVVGRSRGGELALLLGATFPAHVAAVVGYVPSGYVHAGIAGAGASSGPPRSAWTVGGKPVAFLPPVAAGPAAPAGLPGPAASPAPLELRPLFLRGLEDRAAREAAAIPVERIRGPLLLISGEDDRLWPSPVLAEQAVARARAHAHPYPVAHLRYPDAGHMIGPAGLPATVTVILHPLRGARLALGGTPAGNAAAAADSWPRALAFLRDALAS